MTKRQKFAQAFGEFFVYSIMALLLLVLATLSFAMIFGLMRLVGLA